MTPEEQVRDARMAINEALTEQSRNGVPVGAILIALRTCAEEYAQELRAARDALTAALGEASATKPTRAPRKPRAQASESTPETRIGFVLSALELDSPQTLQEVAKMAGVTRAQAQIAIDSLLTDGRVSRERAGNGWRYSFAKVAE